MNTRSPITTHVLDTSRGCPAGGVVVELSRQVDADRWESVGRGATDEDGRVSDLLPAGKLEVGDYRLRFDTGEYHRSLGVESFYPSVTIRFRVSDDSQHYHVPLLVSPYGYSTYRGS